MPSTQDIAQRKGSLGADFAQRLIQGFGSIPGSGTLAPTFDSMVGSWSSPTTPIGFEFPDIIPPQKHVPSNEFAGLGADFKPSGGGGGGLNLPGGSMLPLMMMMAPLLLQLLGKGGGFGGLGGSGRTPDFNPNAGGGGSWWDKWGGLISAGIGAGGAILGGLNRGGGRQGNQAFGVGTNPMTGFSMNGDASFGHPSEIGMFGGMGGAGTLPSPYEQVGPGIWDRPSSYMGGFN